MHSQKHTARKKLFPLLDDTRSLYANFMRYTRTHIQSIWRTIVSLLYLVEEEISDFQARLKRNKWINVCVCLCSRLCGEFQ